MRAQKGQNKTISKSLSIVPSMPFSCRIFPRTVTPAAKCMMGNKYVNAEKRNKKHGVSE